MSAGEKKDDEWEHFGGTMKSLLASFHCGLHSRFCDRPELADIKIFRYCRDEFPLTFDCLIAGQSPIGILILPPILDSVLPNSPNCSDAIVEQRIRVIENLLLNRTKVTALEVAEFIHRWMGGSCFEIASNFYSFSPKRQNPWRIHDSAIENGRIEIELSFETRIRFHPLA